MTKIDATDQALISALAADARRPVARLAKDLGLARTTVQARLDKLERTGVIEGYAVRLGAAARGAMIRATVLVRLIPRTHVQVVARLTAISEVERIYATAGRFDLCLQMRAQTTDDLDQILDRIAEIDGIEGTESLIHLSTRLDRAL